MPAAVTVLEVALPHVARREPADVDRLCSLDLQQKIVLGITVNSLSAARMHTMLGSNQDRARMRRWASSTLRAFRS